MTILGSVLVFVAGSEDRLVRIPTRLGAHRSRHSAPLVTPLVNGYFGQVLASLMVSILLMGVKMSAFKEIMQLRQRRHELRGNLKQLERPIEAEELAAWISDVELDSEERQAKIALLGAAQSYTPAEDELVGKSLELFDRYDASQVTPVSLKHAATVELAETKYDEERHMLLGRAVALIRGATPETLVAYMLSYDSRKIRSEWNPKIDVRAEVVEVVNDHHTIIYNRRKLGHGLSDRAFLNSMIAKKLGDSPVQYVLAGVPIPKHDRITKRDEAGAVRGESFRVFRLTQLGANESKLEYTCSLDLKGLIPQFVTDNIAVPQQVLSHAACRMPRGACRVAHVACRVSHAAWRMPRGAMPLPRPTLRPSQSSMPCF